MKVLLDECVPWRLKSALNPDDCSTVLECNWSGKKNGELLSLAEAEGFEVFLTLDQGVEYQQNLSARKFGIVVVRAKSSRLPDLVKHAISIIEAIDNVRAGQVLRVQMPR